MSKVGWVLTLGFTLFFGLESHSQAIEYSPPLRADVPRRPLWGDTHIHTSFSVDAALTGNTLDPEQAYRFARGQTVTSSSGLRAKLLRPLDFLVISDHAEDLGLTTLLAEEDAALMATNIGKQLRDLVHAGELTKAMSVYDRRILNGESVPISRTTRNALWQRITSAAEANNDPGIFTAMIGFEWTSTPQGNNLHRNVIYRDGKELVDTMLPFTAQQSADPEDLWRWMASYERQTGGQVLAIPHNGNLSNGAMFDNKTFNGVEFSADYAKSRMRWEPLYEVTQIKGDSESHPSLSPDDEFAKFERWDIANLASKPKSPSMLEGEYARSALKRGLTYAATLHVNPFRFGLIGSSDAHTGLTTTREDNFFGKLSLQEPSADPHRFNDVLIGYLSPDDPDALQLQHRAASASGLAAVWATENSRHAIWDALNRREVYATTGTRISVRLFAGWSFTPDDLHRSDVVEYGYQTGVPMGAVLQNAESTKAPSFLINAMRDPDGANLDRIQVIKGWRDETGALHERIYDVAVSDQRTIDAQGRCKTDVGNTVNVERATYSNNIGTAELKVWWRDPNFNKQQHAFYYVRVIEIPTPRWTTYDAALFDIDLPDSTPTVVRERAYTSPIWYTPRA